MHTIHQLLLSTLLLGVPTYSKHAETRLLQELPQAERSKILRMKAEPQPDEIYEVGTVRIVCISYIHVQVRLQNYLSMWYQLQQKQQRVQQGSSAHEYSSDVYSSVDIYTSTIS